MEVPPMTPEEFKQAMLALSKESDVEKRHALMDDLLCAVLRSLGYSEGCDIFDNTDNWYA